jgi:MATE family multidrug resistance protein
MAPMAIYAVAFWIVGVPLAYVIGVHSGHGVPALMWSLCAALLLATLLLAARFHVIAARPLRAV